jgi:hypothetical protein
MGAAHRTLPLRRVVLNFMQSHRTTCRPERGAPRGTPLRAGLSAVQSALVVSTDTERTLSCGPKVDPAIFLIWK